MYGAHDDNAIRYAVLFGQAPSFADEEISQKEGGSQYFNRRITSLLKREQFVKGMHLISTGLQGMVG